MRQSRFSEEQISWSPMSSFGEGYASQLPNRRSGQNHNFPHRDFAGAWHSDVHSLCSLSGRALPSGDT
jgi:hypothetical protein